MSFIFQIGNTELFLSNITAISSTKKLNTIWILILYFRFYNDVLHIYCVKVGYFKSYIIKLLILRNLTQLVLQLL